MVANVCAKLPLIQLATVIAVATKQKDVAEEAVRTSSAESRRLRQLVITGSELVTDTMLEDAATKANEARAHRVEQTNTLNNLVNQRTKYLADRMDNSFENSNALQKDYFEASSKQRKFYFDELVTALSAQGLDIKRVLQVLGSLGDKTLNGLIEEGQRQAAELAADNHKESAAHIQALQNLLDKFMTAGVASSAMPDQTMADYVRSPSPGTADACMAMNTQ